MPNRSYIFHERKPQVDHIFPLNPEDATDAYRECVDVLWNFQPMPADVNNYKRARHPKEFFNSSEGSKYWDAYDFVPGRDSPLWDDHAAFIRDREVKMRNELFTRYGLKLEPRDTGGTRA
jgi:hypothetical protein